MYQAERAKIPKGPKGPPDGYDDALFAIPPIIGLCFEDQSGAFVVTLAQAALQEWPQIHARWALTHVDPDEKQSRIIPTEKEDDASSAESYNWLAGYPGLKSADVKGLSVNGKLVVFSHIHGAYHEDQEFSRGRLYTFEGGRIVPYAPAANILVEGLLDADGDGITDLSTYGPFDHVGEWCGSGFGYRIAGPLLLAHGLPDGTFSMNDAVAVAHAKKECPKSPARIVVKGSEDKPVTNARNVACLRLWGASVASVEARVERECPTPAEEQNCKPGVCSDNEMLLLWAKKTPPLTIR
jgi:hypothetical protein